jgi:hypothetical protein
MSIQFAIRSSDQALLDKATQIATAFAQQYIREGVVGVVFLGGIARGYFDQHADIDIAIFKRSGAEIPPTPMYQHVDGLEIQCFVEDYETEIDASWDMAKRWAYTSRKIFHDPDGLISQLIEEKVPLKPAERKEMLMRGIALSEWYINRLTQLWINRGNLISAYDMFAEGLSQFFEGLFALNHQLVPATKWRTYCVERLKLLPPNFHERIQEVLLVKAISIEEIERRKQAFMEMWQSILPLVEQEIHMPYAEFSQLV